VADIPVAGDGLRHVVLERRLEVILVDLGTPEGDKLTNYPDVADERWLQMELSTCVGVHYICNGFVDYLRTSESYSALRCRLCGLRVTFPTGLRNVDALQAWFHK
jgi:hypothetical protein